MASDWVIVVDRCVSLSADAVFRAWLEPPLVKLWMAPGTMRVLEPVMDATNSGEWQLVMADVDGSQQKASGRYTDVSRPSLLALTWEWDSADYETSVTVSIEARGEEKTAISIEQRGFPSMDIAQNHEAGWSDCLDKLERLVV